MPYDELPSTATQMHEWNERVRQRIEDAAAERNALEVEREARRYDDERNDVTKTAERFDEIQRLRGIIQAIHELSEGE